VKLLSHGKYDEISNPLPTREVVGTNIIGLLRVRKKFHFILR